MEAQLKFVKSNRKGVEIIFKLKVESLIRFGGMFFLCLMVCYISKMKFLTLVVFISLVLLKIFKLNEVGI